MLLLLSHSALLWNICGKICISKYNQALFYCMTIVAVFKKKSHFWTIYGHFVIDTSSTMLSVMKLFLFIIGKTQE